MHLIAAAKKALSTAFHRFIRSRLMAELAIADEALLDKLLNPPSEDRQAILLNHFSRLPPPSTPLSLFKEKLHRLDVTAASFIIAARL